MEKEGNPFNVGLRLNVGGKAKRIGICSYKNKFLIHDCSFYSDSHAQKSKEAFV